MADTLASGASARKGVRVQVPPRAHTQGCFAPFAEAAARIAELLVGAACGEAVAVLDEESHSNWPAAGRGHRGTANDELALLESHVPLRKPAPTLSR